MSPLSRRAFGALLGGTAVAAAAGTAATQEVPFSPVANNATPDKPNILFIFADDLGYGDLSSYGHPDIKTPNIDRLAAQGIRFTDAYSGSATCSPTRFSLYTGRFPGRLRGGLAEPIPSPNQLLGIPVDHPTLGSLIKSAGYDTGLFGKWHAGYLPWYSPTKVGWDTFFGNFGGGLDYFSKLGLTGEYDLYEGEVEFQDLRYYTDIITERAVEYIGRTRSKPWLINLNFTTPHWPWEGPGDKAVSDELSARIRAGEKGVLQHKDGGSLDVYRTMVEDLDAAVGTVLKKIKDSGQEDNTLVVFSSDNGGERYSNNAPFSGKKFGLQEGGIRVPTILRWPKHVKANQVVTEPVYTPDWTPTLLEAAGAAPHPSYPLDGANLTGYLLRGEKFPQRDLFWRTKGERALRRGDWKYYRGTDGQDVLFNLPADPREQANKATAEPALLRDLKASWEKTDATLLKYPG
ncbi:twin-arginine translocation pathway signal protein [Pseudonocardiaceae bacterium YIM PH 21723]|nr:twin-arginine translocation pathway signal protein [Pseudonocardiaceae bacterium YIM PH 21723]